MPPDTPAAGRETWPALRLVDVVTPAELRRRWDAAAFDRALPLSGDSATSFDLATDSQARFRAAGFEGTVAIRRHHLLWSCSCGRRRPHTCDHALSGILSWLRCRTHPSGKELFPFSTDADYARRHFEAKFAEIRWACGRSPNNKSEVELSFDFFEKIVRTENPEYGSLVEYACGAIDSRFAPQTVPPWYWYVVGSQWKFLLADAVKSFQLDPATLAWRVFREELLGRWAQPGFGWTDFGLNEAPAAAKRYREWLAHAWTWLGSAPRNPLSQLCRNIRRIHFRMASRDRDEEKETEIARSMMNSIGDLFEYVEVLKSYGRAEAANQALLAARQTFGDHPALMMALRDDRFMQGRYSEAYDFNRIAFDADPTLQHYQSLRVCAEKTGRVEQLRRHAARTFDRLVAEKGEARGIDTPWHDRLLFLVLDGSPARLSKALGARAPGKKAWGRLWRFIGSEIVGGHLLVFGRIVMERALAEDWPDCDELLFMVMGSLLREEREGVNYPGFTPLVPWFLEVARKNPRKKLLLGVVLARILSRSRGTNKRVIQVLDGM